jgi:hypothetical protein
MSEEDAKREWEVDRVILSQSSAAWTECHPIGQSEEIIGYTVGPLRREEFENIIAYSRKLHERNVEQSGVLRRGFTDLLPDDMNPYDQLIIVNAVLKEVLFRWENSDWFYSNIGIDQPFEEPLVVDNTNGGGKPQE